VTLGGPSATTVGTTVKVNGTPIGTAAGGANGTDLVITFNNAATPGAVQSLIEHIGYVNSSASPSALTREVSFTLNDGDGTANGGNNIGLAIATISYANVNHAPTAVSFANVTTTIVENTNTSAGLKVADIVVTDDALGTNTLTLVGADSAFFEIVGTELRLKAGVLNFESKASYSVQVAADDGSAANTNPLNPDVLSAPFTVHVSDQNETPTAVADNGATNTAFRMTEDDGPKTFVVRGNDILDPDTGAANTVTVGTISTQTNTLGIDASDVNVSVDAANNVKVQLIGTDWQHLAQGQTLDVVIPYTLHGDQPGDVSSADLTIRVTGVNDAPRLTTTSASGSAGANIPLNITIEAIDAAATLGQVKIQGVPSVYTLTAGTEIDAGQWLVSVSDLAGLALTPIGTATAGEFTLQVVATSIEGTSTASTSTSLSVTVTPGATQHSGHVVDGYIADATVFADANNNGILDTGEAHTTTNADGSFTLTNGSGPLVMFGGTDVSTGLAFGGVMTAPAGSTVVTPLTTLVATLAATVNGDVVAAQDLVAAAFGFDSGIDLQTFDPVPAAISGNATALTILSAAIQVQSTITQISTVAGTGSDVIAAIADAITAANGGSVDLSQSTVVENIATQAGVDANAIGAVTDVVSAANASVQAASDVTELAQAAQVAQGEATDALAATDFTNAGQVASLTQTYVTDLGTQVANAQVGDVDGAQFGTLGDDVLTGGGGADSIDGLDGRDQIDGGGGNDFLYGGAGYDKLTGGSGDDLIVGGPGIDRAIYSDATGPITVDMAAGTTATLRLATTRWSRSNKSAPRLLPILMSPPATRGRALLAACLQRSTSLRGWPVTTSSPVTAAPCCRT
jgi:Ca2+-binding RTX toxin-like protein